MKKIIAIHGIIGSGKDTVVTFIKMHLCLSKIYASQTPDVNSWLQVAIENINNADWGVQLSNVKIERFALPLKAVISAFLGCTINDLNSQEFKKMKLNPEIWYSVSKPELTIRDLHTDISDGIKQFINNEIFASTCIERCKNALNDLVIINDLRYPFEMDLCIANNVFTLKIQRPEADAAHKAMLEKNGDIHSSERGLPTEKFDCLVRNDSTYADLAVRLADAMLDMQLVTNDYVRWYKNSIL